MTGGINRINQQFDPEMGVHIICFTGFNVFVFRVLQLPNQQFDPEQMGKITRNYRTRFIRHEKHDFMGF